MILQKDEADLSILLNNLHMLPEAVPDKDLLEHIYLDLVHYNKKNFIITLPFDLNSVTCDDLASRKLNAVFKQLEKIVDAAERAHIIAKIDGREVIPYKMTVNKCKKGFSYTLHYFDGRLKSKNYTQKEMWHHPRLMRCYEAKPDE